MMHSHRSPKTTSWIVKLMWNHGNAPHNEMMWGHFIQFSRRNNYPQRSGTRPFSYSTSRSSTGTVSHTVCGWGHGGTRYISTSLKLHTGLVNPAAISDVRGRHTFAVPLP